MPRVVTTLLVLLACASPLRAETAASESAPLTDWRAADAGIDHRLTLPSAETLHQGELGLNDYGEGRPRE